MKGTEGKRLKKVIRIFRSQEVGSEEKWEESEAR